MKHRWEEAYVCVSRRHNEMKIEHRVVYDQEGIRIEMSLQEFVDALGASIGNPMTLTRAGLIDKLRAATEAVVMDMKNSTLGKPPTRSAE